MTSNLTPEPTPAQPLNDQTLPAQGETFGGFADSLDDAPTPDLKDS